MRMRVMLVVLSSVLIVAGVPPSRTPARAAAAPTAGSPGSAPDRAPLGTAAVPTTGASFARDPAGRLTGVFDGSGAGAEYVYDPNGNVTDVRRWAADALHVV